MLWDGTFAVVKLRAPARVLRTPSLVVAAAVFGYWVPPPELLAGATTPLVAVLVFTAVRDPEWGRLRVSPTFAASALLATYGLSAVFVPLAALLLGGPAQVGTVLVVAGPPTAGSAIVWSRLGGGDAAATTLATTATIGAAPVATSTILEVVLSRDVGIGAVPVARTLLFAVGGGLALSWAVPTDAVAKTTLNRLSLAIIALIIYVGTGSAVSGAVSPRTLCLVGLLALCFLACAAVLSVVCAPLVGWTRAASLFFVIGLRNLGIAVALAATLGVEGAVAAAVTFYIVQQLGAAVAAEGVAHETGAKR